MCIVEGVACIIHVSVLTSSYAYVLMHVRVCMCVFCNKIFVISANDRTYLSRNILFSQH